ncbi:indolepyruvate ferredoxin oxidoreductase family protein [Streptomyces sp. NPDC002619]|uniref:indolepyruvate ferredoxin oxidoreductase family protein n=1 Tax=Streptomyces sp. NPDC002619 TaxID=3364655 RepID=UPI0036CAB2E3
MSAVVSEAGAARRSGAQSFLVRRYADDEGRALLSGVQALARLPLVQMRLDARQERRTGCLISGYEGSPLAGYDLELGRNAEMLREHRVVFQPGVNEELAATAIGGSQFVRSRPSAEVDGVLGVWYGKAPGLDRATDAVRHGNLQGADHRGGVIMLVGDDPATKSSSLPSASELALSDLAVPVLYPGSVAELLEFGLYGIAMSRLTGLWVSLKIVVGVADATASVDLSLPESIRPFLEFADGVRADPDYQPVATALMSNPVRLRLERELHSVRLPRAEELLRRFPLDRVHGPADAAIGVVAAGKTYYDLHQAMDRIGLDDSRLAAAGVRMMKVGALYPAGSQNLREFASGLRKVIVVEEKRGPLEAALTGALYDLPQRPLIVGKTDAEGVELFPAYGELDVDLIAERLGRELAKDVASLRQAPAARPARRPSLPLLTDVSRTPYFCSGCPHSRSTPVPDGSLVGAGIGCHALVTRSPRTDLGENVGLTQMGGEGAQWIGMEPFVGDQHLFQNLGDGTLAHSGTLAIRAAVAAGSNITYKILYNSAVAMTGGQQPVGMLGVANLTRLLQAEGVRKIVITTADPKTYRSVSLAPGTRVHGFDQLATVQEDLRGTPGVTVLIHEQECAAELRRKRKRGRAPTPTTRVLINPRICEGCGDCGTKSNCLSVVPADTEFGTKTQIHQESCNLDQSCVQGHCPSFVTVEVDKESRRRSDPVPVPDLDGAELPQPAFHVPDDFTMRVSGIGGTGIVTVTQIVAMSAVLSGRHVVGLDQTGLAQKGGPVVSDLKVSTRPIDGAAKLARAECDLYLVADVLTGVEPHNLGVASPERTTAVVSTSKVPPASLIGEPFKAFPDMDGLVGQIASVTSPAHLLTLDSLAISNRLFHNDVLANLVLLGAAYQAGAVPLPVTAIEEAIERNGVAVHDNQQAFRRGRQLVADPDGLARALRGEIAGAAPATMDADDRELIDSVPEPSSELRELLTVRVPDLVAYQHRGYASRYVTLVRQAREAELHGGIHSTQFSEAVARYYYKLLAYKDEYEVARLSLEVVNDEFVRDSLGVDGVASYNLLPPVLARFGLKHKIRLGPWFRVPFRLLYGLRRVRGTVLDPFGRHAIRRLERDLIREYEELVAGACAVLDDAGYTQAVDLARAPDLVRGYDEIKEANIAVYRRRLAELAPRSEAGTAVGPAS